MRKLYLVLMALWVGIALPSCVINTEPEKTSLEKEIEEVQYLYELIAAKHEAKLYDELPGLMEQMIDIIGFDKEKSDEYYFGSHPSGTANHALEQSESQGKWIDRVEEVSTAAGIRYDLYDNDNLKTGSNLVTGTKNFLLGYLNYFALVISTDNFHTLNYIRADGTKYANKSVLNARQPNFRYTALSPSGFVYSLFKSSNQYGYFVAVLDWNGKAADYATWNAARQ